MIEGHEPAAFAALLGRLVDAAAPEPGRRWLAGQLAQPGSRAQLHLAFAAAGRRLGPRPLRVNSGEPGVTPALLLQLSGRGLDELGRVALLFSALGADGAQDAELIEQLFLRGGAGEQQAILRALPLLPEPSRFIALGVAACRSSVQTIFEAIACENSFPADRFDELAFNQMVLKALFNGVRTSRIEGLARRAGPELRRMVLEYAAERRAAGRSVPEDIEAIRALVDSQTPSQGSHA
jgi:hypothetical protein